MRSASKKPRLRSKGGGGMSEPRYPSDKSVEVVVILRAYRDQAAIFGPHAKPGFSINGQVGDKAPKRSNSCSAWSASLARMSRCNCWG